MRLSRLAAVVLMAFALVAQAEQNEIEYLLSEIANSSCEFWRNGKTHSAEKASKHLRMKYKRAKKYVKTAEEFIAKLASRSSMSKKPYRYSCPDDTKGFTADWFREKLAEHRARLMSQSR